MQQFDVTDVCVVRMPASNRAIVLGPAMHDPLARSGSRSRLCDSSTALGTHAGAGCRSLPRKLRRSSPSAMTQRTRPDARVLACCQHEFTAHSTNVTCLALGHKSGRVMVTGGDDRKVNLWAVGKPNCIMSLSGHMTPVECVRFGHTEELVCAGSVSGALKIWDLEAARLLRTLTGHKSNIKCVDFHPYGDFLASGSFDTNIKLWDTRRKGCIFTYKGHQQMVNSIKFSPDGQWIVSAGEDGGVKIWDIRAGKMLTEFSRHVCSVADVEFHPHEFLLASAGSDRVVNFWDLESFQLVTSSDGACGAVRCISFSGDGECLFAGCHDLLKVYGWEPFRCYDTISTGWGRVADLAVAQTQLIGATFQSSSVSVYVLDLNRVQPYFKLPAGQGQAAPTPFLPRQSFRKSFIKEKPAGDTAGDRMTVKSEELSDTNVATDPEEESCSAVHVQNVSDYTAIFRPRSRDLNRTPPPPSPPQPDEDGGVHAPAVLCSGTSSSPPVSYTSLQSTSNGHVPCPAVPCAATSRLPLPPVIGVTRSTCSSTGGHHSSTVTFSSPTTDVALVDTVSTSQSYSPSGGVGHHNAMMQSISGQCSSLPTSRTGPLPPDLVLPSAAAESLTSPSHQSSDIVPMTTDRPTGLAVDDFLPQKLSAVSVSSGRHSALTAASECDILSQLLVGHTSMMAVLTHRHRQLEISHSVWCSKDARTALEQLAARSDLAIIVDLLGQLNFRPSIWNLDMCQVVLPLLPQLFHSPYETYMTVGCATMTLILKNFSPMIKTNLASPVYTHGVDISREERYNKCKACYDELLVIRTSLQKRQTLQGKLGRTFRELLVQMQTLD